MEAWEYKLEQMLKDNPFLFNEFAEEEWVKAHPVPLKRVCFFVKKR